jgi:photosystem II stability/assembly factor-like uncharacterized protein
MKVEMGSFMLRHRSWSIAILTLAMAGGCLRKRGEDIPPGSGGAGGAGATGGSGAVGGDGGSGGDGLPAWTPVASGTTANLRSVWVDDGGTTAFVVGDGGALLRSDDGGETWQALDSTTTEDLHAVWGVGGEIYAVGDAGVVVHSLDGDTFGLETSGVMNDLRSLWASDTGHVYAGGSSALLLRSTDGGQSWESLGNPASTTISGIWGIAPSTVFAVAEASLLTSHDDGDTFSYDYLSINAHTDVWAATEQSFFITNDGGVLTSWEADHWLKNILAPTSELYAVWGAGLDDMYVTGRAGIVFHSSDAGDGWDLEETGTTSSLEDVHGAGGLVLVVGDGGIILKRP